MSKSADAFRTISEVADWLGVQAHVLRFWESKFSQIKPVKRAGGRRYYRPADMLLLGGIQKLLHEDGLSIKEVQTILRDLGIAHVSQLSHDLDADGPPAHSQTAREASKKTGGAGHKPAYGSPAEAVSTNTAPINESLPLDPAAAALLSTPAVTDVDMSQEATAQETPIEPAAWQEITTDPTTADGSALTQAPAPSEDATLSSPLQSAEMPHADSPGAEPGDQTEVSSADFTPDSAVASLPADQSAVQSTADDPVSPAPAQMDMELDSPADASPTDPVPEDPAVSTMPSQDEMSGMEMPEMGMPGSEVDAAGEGSQANAQPEAMAADLPASAADHLEAHQEAPSEDHPASTEPDQTSVAETSPASPFPEVPTSGKTEATLSEAEAIQPTEQSSEPGSVLSVATPDLGTMSEAAASSETPQLARIDGTETIARPDRSQSVLSLLEKTTVLPTHIQADVANCAAELRALLTAR